MGDINLLRKTKFDLGARQGDARAPGLSELGTTTKL